MKRFLNSLGIMLALSIVATSCEKAPFLTLSTPKTINFTDQGGTQSITFTANRDWSVSSSDSWCKVSPSSGNKADGNITVTLTCEPNTTYDPRSATLTVWVEELSETITVTQDTNLGLLVSPTSYDLTNAAQSIEVEVRANVKYSVEIDAACKDWITQTGTKALSTEKITFSIAANESYDNREGKITIKQTDGSLSETIVVKQSQTDGLFITTPEYNLSNESHTLSVEVQANVSFEVTPEADWIHYVQTKALNSSTITLTIDANETYDARTGKVSVKQSNGNLTGEITVNQAEKCGLFVNPEEFSLTKEEQTINVEVKYNVEYDVVIPDAAKDWVSIQNTPPTKGLTTETVTFAIAENKAYVSRETAIAFKQKNGGLTGTVKISQEQTDYLSITPQKDSIVYSGGSVDLSIITNVDYEVLLDETYTWVTIGEGTNTGTKDGLTTFVYSISATENEEIVPRYASIQAKSTSANIIASYSLAQGPQPIIEFEDEIVKKVCVSKFDINQDGEVSLKEAKQVTTISTNFFGDYSGVISSFNELKYFESLQTLERMAFSGCSELDSIVLPSGLLSIGYGAFADCSDLVSIMLPASVNDLQPCAFIRCYNLKDVSLSGLITTIPDSAFNECSALSSIEIPNSITTIGMHSFQQSGLKEIIIPNSVTTIEHNAFDLCKQLRKVVMPNGLVKINASVFNYCITLEDIEIPDSVIEIDKMAFSNCHSLKELILPSSLRTIGSEAFAGCKALTQITIPDGVKKISEYLFYDCQSLTKVILPKSTQIIREEAFCKCVSLAELYCQALTPPQCDIWAFEFVPSFTIYVPWQSITDYKNADVWSNYADNIKVDPIVDLGLSVKWAAFNIGTNYPEEYGNYYAWGEVDVKEKYTWATYKWANGEGEKLTKYCSSEWPEFWNGDGTPDNKTTLDLDDDVANVSLGGKWRMPTKAEWDELHNKCKWSWFTHNGVKGYLVESGEKDNDNSIFLPAAGNYTVGGLNNTGRNGFYWSSSIHIENGPGVAWSIDFSSSIVESLSYDRYYGFSIRPVYE